MHKWKPLICLSALLAGTCGIQAAEIRMETSVRVPGWIVLLGDVAKVSDPSEEVVAQLKRIELFPAPLGGRARILRQGEVRELLSLHGVAASSYHITGAERTRIVSDPNRPRQLTPDFQSAPAAPAQLVHFVVAGRTLERGEVIRPMDVELRVVPPQQLPIAQRKRESWAESLDDVVGLEVTRPFQSGQALDVAALRRPLLVRRGEVVTVLARAEGVQVKTSARAMEQGALGDLITLQVVDSRERYTARVIGQQKAEVYASGVVVPAIPIAGTPRPQSIKSMGVSR